MKTAEPIRERQKIKEMGEYYLSRGQIRNYTMLMLGIHTALRISDLLRLRWGDVYDYERRKIHDSFTVMERKTKKLKTVALHKNALNALILLYKNMNAPEDSRPLFENTRQRGKAICRIQTYRIIRDAAEATGTAGIISCHSLRKTFGYHAWKNKTPLPIIMEIYNHSSFSITRRYLGITQDDKNAAYLGLKIL